MRAALDDVGRAASVALRPLQFLLYSVSGLVPRRDDLWVFGSWGGYRFADNAAAFFLFCDENLSPDIDIVWISRRREIVGRLLRDGLTAHWIWSPRGIAASMRAGVYIFDCFSKDINHWLSKGAMKVNLWSGVPLKSFERDIDNPDNRYHKLFHGSWPVRTVLGLAMPWHLTRPDLIIATSEETAEITRRAFDLPKSAVAVTGFPRNDGIVDAEEPGSAGLPPRFSRAVESGRPVFLYLPTFRDSGKPFIDIDWARLAESMERLDAWFFLKLHPVDDGEFALTSERVAQLPRDVDVYELLPHVSALISDYSSIIFDFMLLNRPILYYVPDLHEFVSSSRSLNFDPREIAVGPVCTTSDGLLDAVEKVATGRHMSGISDTEHRRIVRRLHTYVDAGSNRRVLKAISARVDLR